MGNKGGTSVGSGGRKPMGAESSKTPKATAHPKVRDIAWAAGFLEGEGAFYAERTGCERVQARQVQLQPLLRIQELFGGSLQLRKNNRRGFGLTTAQPINEWRCSGSRARGIMMTLYPLLSPQRQQQIRTALSANRKVGLAI